MKRNLTLLIGLALILIALNGCGSSRPSQEESAAGLQVESGAFRAGEAIPIRHTCDGEDLSPALSWSEPPAGTQSLVVIGDDPDAPVGTWVHWVLFNIPPTTRSLPEGVPATQTVAGVGTHGSNSWRRLGYGGPCPPAGSTHRYYFKVYALDTLLDLAAGADKQAVEKAMKGHILAEGQIMGRYSR